MQIYRLWTVRLSQKRDFWQHVCMITSAVSSLKYISILILSFFLRFFQFTAAYTLFRTVIWGHFGSPWFSAIQKRAMLRLKSTHLN